MMGSAASAAIKSHGPGTSQGDNRRRFFQLTTTSCERVRWRLPWPRGSLSAERGRGNGPATAYVPLADRLGFEQRVAVGTDRVPANAVIVVSPIESNPTVPIVPW